MLVIFLIINLPNFVCLIQDFYISLPLKFCEAYAAHLPPIDTDTSDNQTNKQTNGQGTNGRVSVSSTVCVPDTV